MQALLATLNEVPGVVGSMVCDMEGRVLVQSFPALFEAATIQEAATVLADASMGLETITGPLGLLDLRYADSRVILKPAASKLLALLCTKSVNLQMLVISVEVACKKLEKMAMASPPAGAPSPAPVAPAAPAAAVTSGLESRAAPGATELSPPPEPGFVVQDVPDARVAANRTPVPTGPSSPETKKAEKKKRTWFPSL